MFKMDPVKLSQEQIYVGYWNSNNQKHGNGKLISRDGSIREGLWMNDKATGQGRMIH